MPYQGTIHVSKNSPYKKKPKCAIFQIDNVKSEVVFLLFSATNTYASIRSKGLGQRINKVVPEDDFFRGAYTTPGSILPKIDRCETIHIGVVCSGFSASLYFHTLLKSIYFYRVNPLHFHVIVNSISEKVLRTLFDTWNVPQGENKLASICIYNFYCWFLGVFINK